MTVLTINSPEEALALLSKPHPEVTKVVFGKFVMTGEVVKALTGFIARSETVQIVDLREPLEMKSAHVAQIAEVAKASNISLQAVLVKPIDLSGTPKLNLHDKKNRTTQIENNAYKDNLKKLDAEAGTFYLHNFSTDLPESMAQLLHVFSRNFEIQTTLASPTVTSEGAGPINESQKFTNAIKTAHAQEDSTRSVIAKYDELKRPKVAQSATGEDDFEQVDFDQAAGVTAIDSGDEEDVTTTEDEDLSFEVVSINPSSRANALAPSPTPSATGGSENASRLQPSQAVQALGSS